jgi:hypothetical protein
MTELQALIEEYNATMRRALELQARIWAELLSRAVGSGSGSGSASGS